MAATTTTTTCAANNGDDLFHPQVWAAAVLGSFGTGRDIATFLQAAIADVRLQSSIVSLCRGILVQRYVALAAQLQLDDDAQSEIKDVLDVVREDVRLSGKDNDPNYDHNNIANTMRRFSQWCALLDYWERQWRISRQHPHVPVQWMVWAGTCEIPYGPMDAALVTSHWTAGALSYWRHREWASGWSMTHSRNNNLVAVNFLPPYGRVLALTDDGRRRFVLQNRDLASHARNNNEDELVLASSALVPVGEAYEEDITMALVAQSKTKPLLTGSMQCYWDTEQGEEGDWEDTIATLGEHAMRILSTMKTTTTATEESLCDGLEACLEQVYTYLERDQK